MERDYVLIHALAGIATQTGAESMVFKGGTALRLCWPDDYRYSADLDFSLVQTFRVVNPAELLLVAAWSFAVSFAGGTVGLVLGNLRLPVD